MHKTRLDGRGAYPNFRPWTPENAEHNVTLVPGKLDQPLRWREPRMIFVNSMSDLFHELVPDEFIAKVFAVMALAEHHTFQVLTKRPERMRDFLTARVEPDADWLPGTYAQELIEQAIQTVDPDRLRGERQIGLYDDPVAQGLEMPLPNVWLGTSIENRHFVGRADALRETPAAVRFISAEPLLGPLIEDDYNGELWSDEYDGPGLVFKDIDWLIVGGESGRKHRPMRAEWARALRNACQPSCGNCERIESACTCEQPILSGGHTAFFFKQWGGQNPKSGGRELDGRTWDEMPTEAVAA